MATLQKIRNKAGIWVAILIGLSLLAFILTDLFDSRTTLFSGSRLKVAEIGGKTISILDFEEKVDNLTEIYKLNTGQNAVEQSVADGIREQAWQQVINEYTVEKEYKKLGLAVSSEELFQLVQGSNPHPIVRQLFTNQETGEFNRSNLINFLKNITKEENAEQEEQKNRIAYWLYIENEIKTQQINTKYIGLIQKGLTVPSFIAKNQLTESGKKVDLTFVAQHFNIIPDSTISVSASDLKKYYNNHKYLYEQENTYREIEYVTFEINPSEADRMAAEEWITKIKPDFIATEEPEVFVNSNQSDEIYVDKNYNLKDLSDSVSTFVSKAKIGDVYGPYLENNSYKLAKLIKVVNVPDSVKARHILIQPNAQTKEAYDNAKNIADSLKNIIEKGANFDELAKEFSADKSNANKGGDLGWFKEGMMVKPFNDAAFSASKGEIKVVESNFGFHIIKVDELGKETKKYKIAFMERKIEPSSQTFQQIFTTASRFAAENNTYDKFNEAITKQNLLKRNSRVGENDRDVMELQNARQLVRWAYQADLKNISEPIDLTGKYVVAALTSINNKGIKPIQQVKNEVDIAVRKEKKIEKLEEKIKQSKQGVSTIQDLALKLNTSVENAEGISFTSVSIGNAGIEPILIASATNYPKDKLSEPITGSNGVYIIYVTTINSPEVPDLSTIKSRQNSISLSLQSSASYNVNNALKKIANIEDYRSKFF